MNGNSRPVSQSPYDNYHDSAENIDNYHDNARNVDNYPANAGHVDINGDTGSVPSIMDYERPQPVVQTEETPNKVDGVLGRISIPKTGSKVLR